MRRFCLHVGDVFTVLPLLKKQSVHTCVTSPPYFKQRDYGHPDQIGLEPTAEAYIEKLVRAFREVKRVLRDDGTLWLNLNDSCGPKKQLMMIPARVALALQADGWILRMDVIWQKRNIKPESVKDRPTRSHEYIYLLAKTQSYYYDHEAVREPNSSPEQLAHNLKYAKTYDSYDARAPKTGQPGNVNNVGIHSRPGKAGRNRRSVWTVSSVRPPGAHFATFPPELIRPCVLAGSPIGGTVLDIFAGSGTTGVVAAEHERKFVGCELNSTYANEIALPRIRAAYEKHQLLKAAA